MVNKTDKIQAETDWLELLEKAKIVAGVTSDAQIARILGISRAAVSEWRNDRNRPSLLTRLRILDLLGYEVSHR